MNETINKKQYIAMIVMFLIGTFLLTNGERIAGRDTWISIFYGYLICIPYVLSIAYISSKNKGKSLFLVFEENFGKIIGGVFTLVFIGSIFMIAIFTCRTFTEYVQLSSLPYTPQILMAVFLIATCAFGATKSMQTIARVISFLFLALMLFIIVVAVFSFINADFENILPIHTTDFQTLSKAIINCAFNPFGEAFIFLIFSTYLKDGQSKYSSILLGSFVAMIILVYNTFKNILILGIPAYQILYYPSFGSAVTVEGILLVERFEMIISFTIILCLLAKMIMLIKALNLSFKHYLKNIKDIYLIIFIGIIIILGSTYLFKDIKQFFSIAYGGIREITNLIILGIVILTLIMVMIREIPKLKKIK